MPLAHKKKKVASVPQTTRETRAGPAAATIAATNQPQPVGGGEEEEEDDEEREGGDADAAYHLAEALPPISSKPSGAFTIFSTMPAVRRAEARSSEALNL
jgi:hypothetical protein